MKSKKIKKKLLANDRKIIHSHPAIEDFIRNVPDTSEYENIFNIYVSSNNVNVRKYITKVTNISKESIYILLNDSNEEVVDGVLSNSNSAKYISEEALMKIIDSNNAELLITIASNIENYVKCDLSKIINILAKHKSVSVRYNLVKHKTNDIVSVKILKKLSKDEDIGVAKKAAKELERRGVDKCK